MRILAVFLSLFISSYAFGGMVICLLSAGDSYSPDSNIINAYLFENDYTDSQGSSDMSAGPNAPSFVTSGAIEGSYSIDFTRTSNETATVTDANLEASCPLKASTAGSFTVLMRFRVDVDSVDQRFFSKYQATSGYRSVEIFIEGDDDHIDVITGYNSGDNYYHVTHGNAVVAGQTYYLAYSYDTSTRDYRLRVYDVTAGGILGTDLTGTYATAMYYSTAAMSIGNRVGNTSTTAFDGLIDELVIVDEVWGISEIDEWFTGESYTEYHYVTQSGEGSQDGTYGNSWSIADFNGLTFSANNSDDGNVGPRDKVTFSGTVTSQIDVPGSGDSDYDVTLFFDNSFESTVRNANGALRISDESYLTVDGFDGTPTGTSGDSTGIMVYGASTGSHYITIINSDLDDYNSTAEDNGRGINCTIGGGSANNTYITIGTEDNGNNLAGIGNDTGSGDIILARTDHVVVAHNILYGDAAQGSGIDGMTILSCEYLLIEYNSITDHYENSGSEYGEDGIDLKDVQHAIIRYNYIEGNRAIGLIFNYRDSTTPDLGEEDIVAYANWFQDNGSQIGFDDPGDPSGTSDHTGLYLWSNILVDTDDSVGDGYGFGNSGGRTSNTYVYHNTIYTCHGLGSRFGVYSGNDAWIVKNNIIYDDTHNDIHYHGSNSSVTSEYNIGHYTGGTSRIYYGGSYVGYTTVGSNNLNTDPTFTDAASLDFTLDTGSPGLNSGDEISGGPSSITVQGTEYTFSYSTALDDGCDFTTTPPTVVTTTRDSSPHRGAYE